MNETLFASTPIIDGIPVGVIMPFAGNVIPKGWLDCDGSEINRNDYKTLFSVIGTTYGEGDGETTFNIPDFRNKTIWGSDNAGIEKQAGLPNITGSINRASSATVCAPLSIDIPRTNSKGSLYANAQYNSKIPFSGSTGAGTNLEFDASRSNSIYGNSETVQPPAITVRMIIKV